MDLNTVASYRAARTRDDLVLAEGEVLLGGGTWLYSEPQPRARGLVDLTTMGWPATERRPEGLRIAATCTIAELARLEPDPSWRAHPLFAQCADALLASFKVWRVATVGGNVCRGFAAGAMTALCAALDASALVWTPDGGSRTLPVAELVTGNGRTALGPGEVLRALDVPAHALHARTALRRIALAERGRSGALVIGRVDDDGSAVFCVTAAVPRPAVLRYDGLPGTDALARDVRALEGFYTDPFGAADWRRHVSGVLAAQVREELAA